ncbi:putative dehydrogenase [Filimonas zeae]|uniref:Oxidoreductase n=1 Tax=Filimonas zeae TaxID=1737353 RepID=A0A917MXV4_9BACT|nr:Gfo/Idh/MocA family oxidoreductase [Filimonas zeae]MDR6341357.1 putative dehydrogenase [Filimonas zeae]GGH76203.1 oxidoreductase [Filimonas zeae]
MKLRLGMIGGGPGAFIGAVHRIAARIDDDYELVCGAFSSDAARSQATGLSLGLTAERSYGSYKELITAESQLPEHKRVQVISIVTPNHLHFEPARLALENGFHVILDKPATFSLQEAMELKAVMQQSGKLLCLTHTYTGYPMVKQARQLIAAGTIGNVRKVYVQYVQGWLSNLEEGTGNKQASWRTNPAKSGIAGAMGDIGTHAFNLAEYVSGCTLSHLCADIHTVVPGRQLDDDGAVLLKFTGGASGVLVATQIATGAENNIQISVYGEKGGIEWQQNDANSLIVRRADKPAETWRTGGSYTGSFASHNTRTPAGHPEGYLEAFANLYHNFALTVQATLLQQPATAEALDYPGIEEGIRGMAFIEQVIASGKSEQKWTPFIIH